MSIDATSTRSSQKSTASQDPIYNKFSDILMNPIFHVFLQNVIPQFILNIFNSVVKLVVLGYAIAFIDQQQIILGTIAYLAVEALI